MEQNLNLYHIFYEVAKCRNFSIAAKKLFISQPAISKSISKLEENLGTPLFHRSSKGVTMTTDGDILYKHVEKAMLSLQSGEELLRSNLSQSISNLSIGVSATLCKYMLLPLLKNFILENPNIKITISCQSTFETLAALKEGNIDIGLVGIPPQTENEKQISYLPVKTIEDIFAAAEDYLTPFLYKNKSETGEMNSLFQTATFIMLNRDNISRKHTDTFLDRQHYSLSNIIEVNNMDLSIEFAREGLGIACVISDFIKEDIKNGTLRELKLGHRIPKRQIGFAYSSRLPINEAMNTLIQYYQAQLLVLK